MIAIPATVLEDIEILPDRLAQGRGGRSQQHEDGGEARHEQEGGQDRPPADGAVVARAETVEGRAGEKGQIGRHQRQNAGLKKLMRPPSAAAGKETLSMASLLALCPSGRKAAKGRFSSL